MSGLCGLLERQGAPVDPASLRAMLDAGAHRGPDGRGTWIGEGVALGHLALHDTPEDQHVRQPLQEGDLVIAADARVDNRADLLRVLSPEGGGAVDGARLILAAYRRWGVDCVEHLIGDIAFALWDGGARRLLLARDGMGQRPLHYRLTDRQLLFASEVGQILAVPGVPVELDEVMVAAYLTVQPMALERTYYRGIAQLPPGHALVVEGGRHRIWRHWQADGGRRIRHRSSAEYAEQFREIFKEAVRNRLRSDHPVGLMLSGGMDSGAIAATGGWLLENEPAGLGELRTYSFALERFTDCDERHISRLITDRYRLPATGIPADDAFPFADYPAHPPSRDAPDRLLFQPLDNRALGRARADGVTTVMTGHRGDLALGVTNDALGFLGAGLWRDLATALNLTRHGWRRAPQSVAKRLLLPALMAWGPRALEAHILQRYWSRMIGWRVVPPYPDWMRRDFPERVGLVDAARPVRAPDTFRNPAQRLRYEAFFMEVQTRILSESDRLHMRHGLHHADPFSDQRLIEFILAIPQHEVNRPDDKKRLARLAMKGLMPEAARAQVGKISLGPLVRFGLQHGARDTITALCTRPEVVARGYVDGAKLAALREEALRGGEAKGLLETLLLEIWLRRYWR